MTRRVAAMATVLLGAAIVTAGLGAEQSRQRTRRFGFAPRMATSESFDGAFNFCRAMFRSGGDGGGWGVDYPRADLNLSIRLSELTKARISVDTTGEPRHLVVRRAREQLGSPAPPEPDKTSASWQDLYRRLTGRDPKLCPYCERGVLQVVAVISALSPAHARAP